MKHQIGRLLLVALTLAASALLPSSPYRADAGSVTVTVVDQNGDAIPVGFRWLLEENNSYRVVPGVHVVDSTSVVLHQSHAFVQDAGESAGSAATVPVDPSKRYFLSVLAMGYTLGGGPIEAGQTSVTILIHQQPISTAQVSVYVFHDNTPINSAPDAGAENGLAGFRIRVFDDAGEVTTDTFGNILGTTYQDLPPIGNFPGSEDLDADGLPIVDTPGTGVFTDGTGNAVARYLPMGKYAVQAFPTDGGAWVQTSTIEGKPEIDAWVRSGEPPYFTELGAISSHVFIGFVRPCSFGDLLDDCASATADTSGGGTVHGFVKYIHDARPPTAPGLAPGFPVPEAWVGLNNLSGIDEQVYARPADPATGEFTIANVPPGSYQLVAWDLHLDAIIDFRTVIVPPAGGLIDLQDVAIPAWFGTLEGSVFYDANDNGMQDAGEPGLPDQDLNLRYRDGSIYSSTLTNRSGRYSFSEVFPFFKWLVAEVGFGRFKATGLHAKVDAGGPLVGGQVPLREEYVEPAPGDPPVPDSGPELLRGLMLFSGQKNVVDWGKKAYIFPDNGGISGVVIYATTRAEYNPALAAGDDWEPGVPRTHIRLYQACGRNAIGKPMPCDLDGDGICGIIPGDPPTPIACGDGSVTEYEFDTVGAGPADEGDAYATVDTDHFNSSPPEGCPDPDPVVLSGDINGNSIPDRNEIPDCPEIASTWNQVRPGVFDGGWAVEHLPAGTWISEVVLPPGYEIVKEEDYDVVLGDTYVPNPEVLAPPCVGPEHALPEFLSLDGETPNPSNDPYDPDKTASLCTRKEVQVRSGQNTPSDFHVFTIVPKAGRLTGLITDDINFETKLTAPTGGDKFGPAWLPISIQDFDGHEIERTYTDEWGAMDALVPSTWTTNSPIPTGVAPNVVRVVVNHPGMDPLHPDPWYNPLYMTAEYQIQAWPGKTTYVDFPVLPNSGFVAGQERATCDYPDGTPLIDQVNTAAGGPYLAAGSGRTVTITSRGSQTIGAVTYDYSFGDLEGTVSFGGTNLDPSVVTWDSDTILVDLPAGLSGPGQLLVTRGDNGLQTPIGLTLHVVGGGYDPIVRRVGPSRAYTTIQAALDAVQAASDGAGGAPRHDLILVDPGTYSENLVVSQPVKIQGPGFGAAVINGLGIEVPATRTVWVQRVFDLVSSGRVDFVPGQEISPLDFQGGHFAAPSVLWLSRDGSHSAAEPAMLDGFSIQGGIHGSGVLVNAFTDSLRIANNRIQANQGNFGGGIRVGQPTLVDPEAGGYLGCDNQDLWIHHNAVNFNGGIDGGGGIALFNGSDGYRVQDNLVCGNFSLQYGGGISHFGLSDRGRIDRNKVLFNEAFDEGGGIMIAGELPPGVEGPTGLSPGAGSVVLDGNLVQGNYGVDDGGGIRLLNPNGADVRANPTDPGAWYKVGLYNNIVVNNVSGDSGAGISLDDAARVEIVHNTIANNNSTATSVGAFVGGVGSQDSTPQPAGLDAIPHNLNLQNVFGAGYEQTYPDPLLRNNIIHGNKAFYWHVDPGLPNGGELLLSGFYDLGIVQGPGPLYFHPEYCLLTESYPGADATNIIGADPNFEAPYENAYHATQGEEPGLFIFISFTPLSPTGDYHISDAYAAGPVFAAAPELARDYDRDVRPQGTADIGADEISCTGSTAGLADADGDGVANVCDNCPTTANPTQSNQDGDHLGDACDCNPTIPLLPDDTTCNGIDDDCNGAVDDGYAPLVTACGIGACVRAGATSCVGGVVLDSCVAGTPDSDSVAVQSGTPMRFHANTTGPLVGPVLVQLNTPTKYRANRSNPGIGLQWINFAFNDASWGAAQPLGVGYDTETAVPNARGIIKTDVGSGVYSVYTRTTFNIADRTQVKTLLLGVDYDDGYVAYINGVEVSRSSTMPGGNPTWNRAPALHESSNGGADGLTPNYDPAVDISVRGLPALRNGANILAIGVWNNAPASTDLVLVPRLSIGLNWTAETYDDSGWTLGAYGAGYDTNTGGPNALTLIGAGSSVPAGTYSVYTRSRFFISDPAAVHSMFLGADYDDGYVAFVNGVEVARSSTMPAGFPAWNTNAGEHESSNGTSPNYGPLINISSRIGTLHAGWNVLAVGAWNSAAATSTDLLIEPRLSLNTLDVCNGIDDDCDGVTDEDFASQPTNCGTGGCTSTGTLMCVNGEAVNTCLPSSEARVAVQFGSQNRWRANTTGPLEDMTPASAGTTMRYRANATDPGLGQGWTTSTFNDATWSGGAYGVGYETSSFLPNADGLIATSVPAGTYSVYTRTAFTVADASLVRTLWLGADYDDGYVAYINGTEVARSSNMPGGTPAWNAAPASHESSNAAAPDYGTLIDVSAAGVTALQNGTNILAIAVYNTAPSSTDLVLVPRLSIGLDWAAETYDAAAWQAGTFGVGYDTAAAPNALALLSQGGTVPAGTLSAYTRATFEFDPVAGYTSMFLGVDYDDGFVAYLNGVEVARSASMPAGAPLWNTSPALHESSNGTTPNYGALIDLTPFLGLLHLGQNVLAIGVWNDASTSTDLVLVPRLSFYKGCPIVAAVGPVNNLMLETEENLDLQMIWDAVPNAAHYAVVVDTSPAGAFATMYAADVMGTPLVTGMPPGNALFFKVYAVDEDGLEGPK